MLRDEIEWTPSQNQNLPKCGYMHETYFGHCAFFNWPKKIACDSQAVQVIIGDKAMTDRQTFAILIQADFLTGQNLYLHCSLRSQRISSSLIIWPHFHHLKVHFYVREHNFVIKRDFNQSLILRKIAVVKFNYLRIVVAKNIFVRAWKKLLIFNSIFFLFWKNSNVLFR